MPKRIGTSAVLLTLLLVAMPAAHAFFPLGFYDDNNIRRILTWDRDDFDQNNNGVIETGEGLDVILLGGDQGFTESQIEVVRESLATWGVVPTSYASFRVDGIVEDPIQGSDLVPDFLNVIAWDLDASDTGGGIIGLTSTLFLTGDGYVDVGGGRMVYFGAGEIIDSDIELDPFSLQRVLPNGTVLNEPLADLKATLVHELGHMLGLGHPPLSNLRSDLTDPNNPLLVESEVLWLTDGTGVSDFVGATPTLFPFVFMVEREGGVLEDGADDLAPDDISGISWLYPRGSQSSYFNFIQRARTSRRTGSNVPTRPIWGAHIVAWADHDNNAGTPMVPLFSTMSGLYEDITNFGRLGHFEFKYLWKQLEVPGETGALFSPAYAFTMNALNQVSYERQAPVGIPPEDVDSIHQGTTGHDTIFLSEVFHEVDNVLDISNVSAGTPLVWSFNQNTLVSADTGRTIGSILGETRPLFGEPDNVCPINVIESKAAELGKEGGVAAGLGGIGGPGGPNGLRRFRDQVLLQSAAGTAFVDLYYRVAPSLARLVTDHGWARTGFGYMINSVYWVMEHGLMAMAVVVLGMLGAAAGPWRRLRRAKMRGAALLVIALALGVGGPALGRILYRTTFELTAESQDLVQGTVVATTPFWVPNGKIHTEIVVQVEESLKGGTNKQSNLTFTVPGGTIGILAMRASEMPIFNVGDEVIVWIYQRPDGSNGLLAGQRGVVRVLEEQATGKRFVYGESQDAAEALGADQAAMANAEKDGDKDQAGSDGRITLEDYLDYLRGIVRELKRQGR